MGIMFKPLRFGIKQGYAVGANPQGAIGIFFNGFHAVAGQAAVWVYTQPITADGCGGAVIHIHAGGISPYPHIPDMVGKNRAYGVAGQGAALAAPVRVTQESIMGLVV